MSTNCPIILGITFITFITCVAYSTPFSVNNMQTNAFKKEKIEFTTNKSTRMVTASIQDEDYTLMEPLLDLLQSDERLAYTGYKIIHPLKNEIELKMLGKEMITGNGVYYDPVVCLGENLVKLVENLNELERFLTNTQ